MAYNATQWEGAENDGHPFYAVETLPVDKRKLNKVALVAGINDLFWKETVAKTKKEYHKYHSTIKATRIFCVGIPEITSNNSLLPKIQELNAAIKKICGEKYYIDTWKIRFTSIDGEHPDDAMNALIEQAILAADGKINVN
jgi:hypothetical protein